TRRPDRAWGSEVISDRLSRKGDLLLKPPRGHIRGPAPQFGYLGLLGPQVQIGLADVAHSAVDLVGVERGPLVGLVGLHLRDRNLPAGSFSSGKPPHCRGGGE